MSIHTQSSPMDRLGNNNPTKSLDRNQDVEKEEHIDVLYSPIYCCVCTSTGRGCRPPFEQPEKSQEHEQQNSKDPRYHTDSLQG